MRVDPRSGWCRGRGHPRQVDRAGFADVASPKQCEDPVDLHEGPPESLDGVGVVRAVLLVLIEWNGLDHLGWTWMNRDADTKFVEGGHRGCVERRDRSRLEDDMAAGAIGGSQLEHVVEEIELNLETSPAGVHERGGEAAGGHVHRHVPPLIDHRRECHADLADDLGPHVQRVARVRPRRQREIGPHAPRTPGSAEGVGIDEPIDTKRRQETG